MEAEKLDVHLKDLQQLVQVLVKQYRDLQREHEALKKELVDSQKHLMNKEEHFNQLQRQLEASRLGLSSLSERDKIFLQKRIDSYLADIEKCLAVLNT